MAGDHNSTRSNTTSTKVDGEKVKDNPTFAEVSGGGGGSGSEQVPGEPLIVNGEKVKDNPTFAEVSGGGGGSGSEQVPGEPLIVNGEKVKDNPTFAEVSGGGGGPYRDSFFLSKGSGGGGTTGLKSTLGVIKSGISLVSVIILVAASADVYKMYDDHVTINLEDHVTDAVFQLTGDRNSIVGEIAFDIPKMGYFDKSIDVLIHLKILESDPTTEDDFTFEYNLGSGEETYDEFRLDDLDPVTKEKIDNGDPLDIEYTITITIIYLGVELGPTTSEIGTKITTMQTA